MLRSLLVLTAFALPVFAEAQQAQPESRPLVTYAVEIPAELASSGTAKVGSTDLAKLAKDISKVKFGGFPLGFLVGSEVRSNATYNPQEKQVLVTEMSLGEIGSIEARAFLLHEALGALGYLDDRYEVSTALYILNKLAPSERDLPIYAPLKEIAGNLVKRGTDRIDYLADTSGYLAEKKRVAKLGGGTGVGGGGDPIAVRIKLALMHPELRSRLFPESMTETEIQRLFARIELIAIDRGQYGQKLGGQVYEGFSWQPSPDEVGHRIWLDNRYWVSSKNGFNEAQFETLKRMIRKIAE